MTARRSKSNSVGRVDLGLDYLSARTEPGVFYDGWGIHYWILDCQLGRVSVLLDRPGWFSSLPPFSFHILCDTPANEGTWIGPVELFRGESKQPKRAFNGFSGVIYQRRRGLALKACGPDGSSCPLTLSDWEGDAHVDEPYAVEGWSLAFQGYGERTVYTPFKAPLAPYKQHDWAKVTFEEPKRTPPMSS